VYVYVCVCVCVRVHVTGWRVGVSTVYPTAHASSASS
jgi:hypothetical protein